MWLKEFLGYIWLVCGMLSIVFVGMGIIASIIAIVVRFVEHLF